jgi:hypothetical protein
MNDLRGLIVNCLKILVMIRMWWLFRGIDDDLKIAWRYKDQPARPSSTVRGGNSFNLLKTISKDLLGTKM